MNFEARYRASLERHLEAVIEHVRRDALGGRNRPSLEIPLEVVTSEFGDTLGSCDRASLEMHLEAVKEPIWRYSWRLWASELGAHNRAS
jgi:hypothetical protein